ncbi:GNAT family N-acetyltransferase [Patescibacteria group bacterium]|nr:GNAT family N-acetyltransferase [Patescibacteria group bacterium]
MDKIALRKIIPSDIKYFQKWWRDKNLIALTSGNFKSVTDAEIEKYFSGMVSSKTDHHFMIDLDQKTIGHISLNKRKDKTYETQIVIGYKKYWGKGYGVKAIKLLLTKAKRLAITKIYLEVRPENIRAIKTYEKVGFRAKGIKKHLKNPYQPETLKMVYQV